MLPVILSFSGTHFNPMVDQSRPHPFSTIFELSNHLQHHSKVLAHRVDMPDHLIPIHLLAEYRVPATHHLYHLDNFISLLRVIFESVEH